MAGIGGKDVSKYIVYGGYYSYVIEAEDWESAFWKAIDGKGDYLQAIVKIPNEDEE